MPANWQQEGHNITGKYLKRVGEDLVYLDRGLGESLANLGGQESIARSFDNELQLLDDN